MVFGRAGFFAVIGVPAIDLEFLAQVRRPPRAWARVLPRADAGILGKPVQRMDHILRVLGAAVYRISGRVGPAPVRSRKQGFVEPSCGSGGPRQRKSLVTVTLQVGGRANQTPAPMPNGPARLHGKPCAVPNILIGPDRAQAPAHPTAPALPAPDQAQHDRCARSPHCRAAADKPAQRGPRLRISAMIACWARHIARGRRPRPPPRHPSCGWCSSSEHTGVLIFRVENPPSIMESSDPSPPARSRSELCKAGLANSRPAEGQGGAIIDPRLSA